MATLSSRLLAPLKNSLLKNVRGLTKSCEIRPHLSREPILCQNPMQALECIKSNMTVYIQGIAATPFALVGALTKHGVKNQLKNVKIVTALGLGPADYCNPENVNIFRCRSVFVGDNIRQAISEGRADYIPVFLQEIPLLFHKKVVQPDVALIHVSPPDEHGFCSLGTNVDAMQTVLKYSKVIIAQINPKMPRTFGDALIHQSHFDFIVNVNMPLPEYGGKQGSDVEAKIGKLIADNLVEDGATLQLGIGSIPDAVLAALSQHKNLGIHTEMFSDGVVDLINTGVITNDKKTIHKGRLVSTFCIGTQKLYDFLDNNPSVEMLRVEYVNNVGVIAKNAKMTAVNAAIEVDLTGQVCSDSIGTTIFSGTGGQVDFIRGAAEGSDGKGKPIIVLPSTTSKGKSKINSVLKTGAGVVTSRSHVHYIVTEYGIADLFGKSLVQRAYALIQISHPDHRERLERAAFERFKTMPAP